MPAIPRVPAGSVAGPPGPANFRPQADTRGTEALVQLGQELQGAALKSSQRELREARFDSALRVKEEKARRNQALRQALFGANEEYFALQNSFVENEDPLSMVDQTTKQVSVIATKFGKMITHPPDKDLFNLRTQAAGQDLISKSRTISIQKMKISGLAQGEALADTFKEEVARNPGASDEALRDGIRVYSEFNQGMREAGLIDQVEEGQLNEKFDTEIGLLAQEQDAQLVLESGKTFLLQQHIARINADVYPVPPEDRPGLIESVIKKFSVRQAQADKAGKAARVAQDLKFRIAMDVEDFDALSTIMGRRVDPNESMIGVMQEAFQKGIIIKPETVNAIEAEVETNQSFIVDEIEAEVTAQIIQTTTVAEIDDIIEDLVARDTIEDFSNAKDGPAARKALIIQASAKKDKLIKEIKDGTTGGSKIIAQQVKLAEQALEAKKEVGIFGAFGTRETNEKIKTYKRLLNLRVNQGEKPFAVLAELLTEFERDTFDVAKGFQKGGEVKGIPFDIRFRVLIGSAPQTENLFDDQELEELIRLRTAFIAEVSQTINTGLAKQAEEEADAAAKKEKEENSLINKFKKLLP